MIEKHNGFVRWGLAIGLAIGCLVSSRELSAQDVPAAPCCLVIAADAGDAACARRLGGRYVEVKRLFAPESGASPRDEQACNDRLLRLRTFTLYIARADMCCSYERFWRARLIGANPGGRVHWISRPRCLGHGGMDSRIWRAIEVHRALMSVLPDHQTALDKNLRAELQRLRAFRGEPFQFVSNP